MNIAINGSRLRWSFGGQVGLW